MSNSPKPKRPAVIAAWIGFLILAVPSGILLQSMGPVIEALGSLGEGAVDRKKFASAASGFITLLPVAMILIPTGSLILFFSLISITRGYQPRPT